MEVRYIYGFGELTFPAWLKIKFSDPYYGKHAKDLYNKIRQVVESGDTTMSQLYNTPEEKSIFLELTAEWKEEEYIKEQIFDQMPCPSNYDH